MDKDYTNYTREQLMEELERRENYNRALQKAIRNFAMNLLEELNKYRQQL